MSIVECDGVDGNGTNVWRLARVGVVGDWDCGGLEPSMGVRIIPVNCRLKKWEEAGDVIQTHYYCSCQVLVDLS